ncbi:MAG: hypothetical protein ACK5XN_18885 [Bacteroidota bacterium]
MKIRTDWDYLNPVYPWRAWDDSTHDGAEDAGPRARIMGAGPTERAAIEDLKDKLRECGE